MALPNPGPSVCGNLGGISKWRQLVNNLVEEINDYDFLALFNRSKDQMTQREFSRVREVTGLRQRYEFVNALEDSLGEDRALDFLIRVLEDTSIHEYHDSVKYAELFRQFRENKIIKQRAAGKTYDPGFVGRWDIQNQILQCLQTDHLKGVVVCGMPGMGKSSLAHQICFRLTTGYKNWRIVDVPQGDNHEISQLYGSMIGRLQEELHLEVTVQSAAHPDDRKRQFQALVTALTEQTYNYLILLDNMDGYCTRQEDLNILRSTLDMGLLYAVGNATNVKFLLTTSTRLSFTGSEKGKQVYRALFSGQMAEFELEPLTAEEVRMIFEKCSIVSNVPVTDGQCKAICDAVDGNAMAVLTVAGLLHRVTLEKLVESLHQSSSLVQSHMTRFLEKSFETQEDSLQVLMSRLTVFQTGQFDLSTAVAVDVGMKLPRDERKTRTKAMDQQLVWLTSNHLIENEKVFVSGQKRRDNNFWYLQRLVFDYLNEKCSRIEKLKMSQDEARDNFMRHFCNEVVKYGEKNDVNWTTLRQMVDMHIVHIRKFFNILSEDKKSLLEYLPEKRDSTRYAAKIVQLRKIFTIAEYCLNPFRLLRFVEQQRECALASKNLYLYLYWKALEIQSLLLTDSTELAEESLDGVFNKFRICNTLPFACEADGWTRNLPDEIPAVGKLFLMKAKLYHNVGKKERNKELLTMALTYLQHCTTLYHIGDERARTQKAYPETFFIKDKAIVENLKGCVYFQLRDLDKAMDCHKEAEQLETKLKCFEKLDPYFTDYRNNMAATYHQLGLSTQIESERNHYLDIALKIYNQCLKANANVQNTISEMHMVILYNKAELFYIRREFEKSLEMGREMLRIAKLLYRVPHTQLTMMMERVANYLYKLGNREVKEDKNEVKGRAHLQEALDLYGELVEVIRMGGLPFQQVDDAQLYRALREQLHLGQLERRPRCSVETYDRIISCIQSGNEPTDVPDRERAAIKHVLDLVHQRKLDLPSNRTYRHVKENHVTVMSMLNHSDREIRKVQNKYKEFESGFCNKRISRRRRELSRVDTEELVREGKAEGAKFIPDEVQMLSDSDTETDDSDLSNTEDESTSESDQSAASCQSGGKPAVSSFFDVNIELAESRRRRDSGMIDDDIEVCMATGNETDDNESANVGLKNFVANTPNYSKEKESKSGGRLSELCEKNLMRQISIDDGAFNPVSCASIKNRTETPAMLQESVSDLSSNPFASGSTVPGDMKDTDICMRRRMSAKEVKMSWRSSSKQSSLGSLDATFQASSLTDTEDSAGQLNASIHDNKPKGYDMAETLKRKYEESPTSTPTPVYPSSGFENVKTDEQGPQVAETAAAEGSTLLGTPQIKVQKMDS